MLRQSWLRSVSGKVSLAALAVSGAAVAAAAPSSCAAGNELGTGGAGGTSLDTTTSATTSTMTATATGVGGGVTVSASASSGGGMGGAGGATSSASGSTASAGGAGGAGGATSSSSASSSSASASSSSASSSSASSSSASSSSSSGTGGGSPTGTVLMLAGGTKLLAGEYHVGGGWTTMLLNGMTDKAPGLVTTGANSAVGVIRNIASNNDVAYTTWTPGSFQPFKSIQLNVVATQAAPALVGSGTRADLVFLGNDNKHYYGAYVAAWAPAAEAVGSPQSFGPSAAGATAIGSDTIVAFAGQNGDLYDQTRTGGVWQAAAAHNLGNVVALTPSIIAPTMGPVLMIVYVRSTDAKILYTTKTAGVWSAPAVIDANSFTNDPVALVALPGGGAVAAFRGLDSKIYFSRYTPGQVPAWSPPGALANPNFATPSKPGLAVGVGGVDAEMGFVNSADGSAYHARLTGLSWTVPVMVGGTMLTTVAVASAP